MNFRMRNSTIVVAAALTLITSACVAPPPAQPSAPATPASSAARVSEALVIAAATDNYRLEDRPSLGAYPVNGNIYETLVRVTQDYQLEPLLATEWSFVEPNTWRFKLRKDVTFHDGQPFTAKAVLESMNRNAAVIRNSAGIITDSVKIVDDYTVDITPNKPNKRLVQQITHPIYSILASGSNPKEKPIGTGPFKFVSYKKGETMAVEKNNDYWGEKAKSDQIIFKFIPDANTRVLALKAGEVHLIYDMPRELSAELNATPGLKVSTSKVGAYEAFYMNVHSATPFNLTNDAAVREAIAYAINKSVIVNDVWLGNADVNNSMIPVLILGDAAKGLQGKAFDPNKAKEILDKAGWAAGSDGIRAKDGKRLALTMIVGFPNPEVHKPLPEIVQAQLKEVGIELKIELTPDTATYSERMKNGQGDLWVELGNQNDANPCFLPNLLFRTDGAAQNYAKLFSPGKEFDALMDTCQTATDPKEVQQAAADGMKIVIDQANAVLPVAGVFRTYAHSDRVQGFVAHPSFTNQGWWSVSLAAK